MEVPKRIQDLLREGEKVKQVAYPYSDYYITSRGRVISAKTDAPVVLATADRGPYLSVSLRDVNGQNKKTHSIHSLVIESFVGERPEGMQTRHLNGDCHDNRISNLVYGTPEENYEDRKRHGTCNTGERHWKAEVTSEDVIEIRERYAEGAPQPALAEEFGITADAISKIVVGISWQHVGGPITIKRRKGVFLHNAKLDDDKVREIRALYATGEYSQSALGDMYGCTQTNIGRVVRRQTWGHVI